MNIFSKSKSIRKAISISILNQGLSSATNFIFGVYLVRVMTPEEFGLYGIGFAISLFFAGIGNSIFLTQMTVNHGDKNQAEKHPYLGRMFTGLLLFCLFTSAIFLIAIFISPSVFSISEKILGIGFATLIASNGFLLKDFFIRQAYVEQTEIKALTVNVAVTVTLALTCIAQLNLSENIASTVALWLYGISNFSGAVVGFISSKFKIMNMTLSAICKDTRDAWWGGGGWYLLVTCANAIQTQAHTIVGAILLGPVGVATMNAARLLLTPPIVLLPALNQVFLPRLVAKRKINANSMSKTTLKISVILTIFTVIYIVILSPAIDFIANVIIKSRYDDLKITTYGWCITAIFIAARSGLALENHANKEFKIFFYATLTAGFSSILSAILLIKELGTVGGPLSLAVGEIILIISLLFAKKYR